MTILGIESSCDECAAAVVVDGKEILSNIVATQIPFHEIYDGVVPEIASRKHTEWISQVVNEALNTAGLKPSQIDGVAVTVKPGLLGSLLVGLSFAKAFAWSLHLPFIGTDHMLAHLYAPRLSDAVPAYPFLGLLVSGGHTIICKVDDFDTVSVLGTTIDDAVGEAFDKVSKHYGLGYPGGAYIDKLAVNGNAEAFSFPMPNLHKSVHKSVRKSVHEDDHRYDVSYSGLKTAVINQLDQFRRKDKNGMFYEASPENIAASFQKTAVDILLRALLHAVEDTGLTTVVAGGGVAANSYLRSCLENRKDLHCIFPPLHLCGDNGAMVAGLGYQYLARSETSSLNLTASSRVTAFKRRYP